MYLRLKDYLRLIQDVNLQQVINADNNLRELAEKASQEECEGYLKSKYDTSVEFQDTTQYGYDESYTGDSLVYLDALPYDATRQYLAADKELVLNGTTVYQCTSDTPNPAGLFSASFFTVIGKLDDLYFVSLPYLDFDYYHYYKKGDRIFYKGKIYQAKVDTTVISHEATLEYRDSNDLPSLNYAPDFGTYGANQWGTGTVYTITNINPNDKATNYTDWTAGTYAIGDLLNYNGQIVESLINSNDAEPLTDITSWQSIAWTKGDNRSQKIVEVMVDITLYNLHARISPNNIPELRKTRYKGLDGEMQVFKSLARYPLHCALGWLQACAVGDVLPPLPSYPKPKGQTVSWGSKPKMINSY